MILLNGSNAGELGDSIARKLGIKSFENEVKHFPDNELYVKLGADVSGEEVIIVQNTALTPSESLFELFITARTARELGAEKIVLIVPYLAYMRQDKRFNEGEVVTAYQMAFLINNSGADELITIDPHLHRIKELSEVFSIKSTRVTAIKDIAEYVKSLGLNNPVIIGPDEESDQWAGEVAKLLGLSFEIYNKIRSSSVNVSVKGSYSVLKGKDVVIVDDIISTGGTMLNAAIKIKEAGADSVHAVTTHGLFLRNVEELESVFDSIASCNTVTTKFTKIDLAGTIAGAL